MTAAAVLKSYDPDRLAEEAATPSAASIQSVGGSPFVPALSPIQPAFQPVVGARVRAGLDVIPVNPDAS